MENINVIGRITAMSNKISEDFKQDNPTKTVYISVDTENADKLIDFGLKMYTAEDGTPFFIVKASRQVHCYVKGSSYPIKLDMTTKTGTSYQSKEDTDILLNIISSEYMGNSFYRLNALKLNKKNDIEEIQPIDPFADDNF
jgi:hypothetical protein